MSTGAVVMEGPDVEEQIACIHRWPCSDITSQHKGDLMELAMVSTSLVEANGYYSTACL